MARTVTLKVDDRDLGSRRGYFHSVAKALDYLCEAYGEEVEDGDDTPADPEEVVAWAVTAWASRHKTLKVNARKVKDIEAMIKGEKKIPKAGMPRLKRYMPSVVNPEASAEGTSAEVKAWAAKAPDRTKVKRTPPERWEKEAAK